MTLKEAKEILNKEGWCSFQTLSYKPKGLPKDDWEKPEVYDALKVCWDNYIMPLIKKETFNERKERLESGSYTDKTTQAKSGGVKDYEKVAQIVDKLIEEEGEPINGEHLNPALHDSAKDFNDALLDEQSKQIKELTKQNKKLNDIIASRNNEIYELQEKVKKMSKLGKQIAHLNEVIGKKNAQIKDYKIACEEHDWQLKDYMLSDKNKSDMISGLKKLNEKYRHQLADATISKVNEQALKSAESALVYKDKVIDRLKKKLEATEKSRKEYCLYGVGANNFIKRVCSGYIRAYDSKVFDSILLAQCGRFSKNGLSVGNATKYISLSRGKYESDCDKLANDFNHLTEELKMVIDIWM